MKKGLMILGMCTLMAFAACNGSTQGSTDGNTKKDTNEMLDDGTGAPGSGTGSAGRGTINDTTQTPQDTGSYNQPKP
jgi:hypothetical protein